MNKYDDRTIIRRNWPDVTERDDGRWYSMWNFELDQVRITESDLSMLEDEVSKALCATVQDITRHSNGVFEVTFRLTDKLLTVETFTTSHLIGSENAQALIELFTFIDTRVGSIVQIQSQPRKVWPPWSREGEEKRA